jgi:hypothetical protein
MLQKPSADRLEAELGSRANMLRVSIHTDLGRQLGERYNFEAVPLFIIFGSDGNELARQSTAPAVSEVLNAR